MTWWTTHVAAVSAAAASARSWGIQAVTALSWQALGCLVVVSVLHYLAAAVSARAAAGVPMPVGELVAVQLAAAAANRVTPAGLGGAALLARHLSRRGRLSVAESAAAVSLLAVVNAVASASVLAVLVGVGAALDVAGARREVPLLVGRLMSLVPISGTGWLWTGAALLVGTAVATWLATRQAGVSARVRALVASYFGFAHTLMRQRARMTVMLLTSATTSVLLGTGFAAAATLSPDGPPITAFGALVIGCLLAAAVGGAVPAPSGLGAVDAALVGVLLADGVHTATAIGIVIGFRVVTFWSPAVIGLGLVAPLRRRGAV